MHILYFHQHFSTPAGATGTRSYEMARALIDRGHEVTVVCGEYEGGKAGISGEWKRNIRRGQVDGINIIQIHLPYSNSFRLRERSIIFLRYALRSIIIALCTKYDLLFATSTPLTASIPGIAMRFLKPWRPFIFEVRDLWPELPREMGVINSRLALRALSCLEWLSYNTANACVGLSPGIVKGIRRRCSKNKKVAMIPNGCDLELFHSSPEPKPQKNNGQQVKLFRAVFTGAHGVANGLDSVLDAANELKKRNRLDIELNFIGEGRKKPDLVARAKKEELTNCRFHEPISKTELVHEILKYHTGLMILANVPAFYYGTSPNKFFDYIACGLPVLCNYPGWLSEMINEHQCGMTVEPDSPEAFADALEYMADHPEKLKEMSHNSRKLAQEQFDRRALAQEFCDFLEQNS